MKNHIAYGVMAALLTAALPAGPSSAQDKHEFVGQLLTNQQGELCTMCEADLRCEATPPAPVPSDPQALGQSASGPVAGISLPTVDVHFFKRDFWGQMSTVLDYFPFTRQYGLYHSREVEIKQAHQPPLRAKAKLDLAAKRIDVWDAAGQTLVVDRSS
jgi:hypothetical protein